MQMQMNTSLSQRLEQKMILAPRMIQSMEILQLPILALQERVEQELLENPVLERVEPAETPEEEDEEKAAAEETAPDPDGPLVIDEDNELDFNRLEALNREWDDHFNEEHRPSRNGMDEESDRKHDAMQNMPDRPPSLQDHLTEQLSFLDVDHEQHELLRYVISHIADNGWLGTFQNEEVEHGKRKEIKTIWVPYTLEELVKNYSHLVSLAEIEGALMMIQRLDPPGVGARDLKECLLLQLTPEMPHRDLVRSLILNHLEDVNQNRLPMIERKTGAPLADIQEAIEVLRRLETQPGARFSAKSTQYVVPDVIVDRTESGDYEVRLYDDWTPNIYIPRHWYERYKQKGIDPKEKEYLKRKLQSAEWLYDAIRQRRNTLEKVTKAIIQHQRAFLDRGPEHIEPLKMQQIADQVGVHVTTVSRAVDDKWAQTPRGLFPLKRFFGGGTKNEVTGEEVAYETIKNKLLELIGGEDKSNPLSDEELVERLNQAGYPVKRRTVTKYRKMLDIPSSRQRKDWTAVEAAKESGAITP
jgi:RNA polymerase sigma-54 factor